MKFTLYIPVGNVTPEQFQSMTAVTEMAQALENAGVDACCVTDHPAPSTEWLHANGHDALDPFTALAFIAAASTTLMLQTSILVMPYRNPFITAKAATTLQILSGGRLLLGIGAGYQKEEFDALGIDFHKRGVLTDEALETVRQIWKGGVIEKQGSNFTAVGNEPRPAPDPAPKIWIGGSSNKAIARAAKMGDGWCPFFSVPRLSKINRDSGIHSVADLQEKIQELEALRAANQKSDPFDINIAPQRVVKEHSKQEAEQFVEALQELESVGVNWTTVNLTHPSRAAYLESVQWFGEEVISHFR